MKNTMDIASLSLLSIVLGSCGSVKDDKTVYATVVVENSVSSDNSRTDLVKRTQCERDADNSVFKLELASDDGVSSLQLRITGFKSTPQSYTCTQAVDNKAASGLGGKFDTCFVKARVPSPTKPGTFNGYNMFRDEAEKDLVFTYGGTCQISISELGANAKGVVLCSKMIQTYLNGFLRNPVDAAITADVRGEFSCPL